MAESDNQVIILDNSMDSVAETVTVSSGNNISNANVDMNYSHYGQNAQPILGFPNYYLAIQNEASPGYARNPDNVIRQSEANTSSAERRRGFSIHREATISSAANNMAAPMNFTNELQNTQKMCREQQNALTSLTAAVNSLRADMAKKGNGRVNTRKRPASAISDSESDSHSEASEGELSDSESDMDRPPSPKSVRSQREKTPEISKSDRKIQKLKQRKETFVKEITYAPAVPVQLSETINEGLRNPVEHKSEHVKMLLDKYVRPENCEFLSVPKVEKSLWTSKNTNKEIKDSDKLLQRTQLFMTKGMVPIITLMNRSLECESVDAEEVMDLAMDAFTLLAYGHRDLSAQRKRLLTPAINSKYRALCQESANVTPDQLFGEDLAKRIKEIDENKKLENDLVGISAGRQHGKGSSNNYRSYDKQAHSTYHSNRANVHRRSFLGKKRPHNQNNQNNQKPIHKGHRKTGYQQK